MKKKGFFFTTLFRRRSVTLLTTPLKFLLSFFFVFFVNILKYKILNWQPFKMFLILMTKLMRNKRKILFEMKKKRNE